MLTGRLPCSAILLVEDEPLLAFDIIDQIELHNCIVQEHVTTLEKGLQALRRQKPDACILNKRLGPVMVYDLADDLLAAGIPFIFASSEPRKHIADRFADIPLHSKPIDMIMAAAGLTGVSSQQ